MVSGLQKKLSPGSRDDSAIALLHGVRGIVQQIQVPGAHQPPRPDDNVPLFPGEAKSGPLVPVFLSGALIRFSTVYICNLPI
jgi:hypothetical protein